MMNSFEKDLQKLGLSEKESKVYLASLEIGPSPVQEISNLAKVNRATTYVMIEALKERGLMASVTKGKKVFFMAEPPKHLSHLADTEVSKAQQKKMLVEAILPKMSEMILSLREHPQVLMFEGLKGLKEVHEDIILNSPKNGSIENIAAVDDAREHILFEDMHSHWDQLSKKKIKIRALYTKHGADEKIPNQFRGLWQERRISEKIFDFHGEIAIYGDKIAMLTYKGKILSVIIDSQVIAQTMRTMFELAWSAAGAK